MQVGPQPQRGAAHDAGQHLAGFRLLRRRCLEPVRRPGGFVSFPFRVQLRLRLRRCGRRDQVVGDEHDLVGDNFLAGRQVEGPGLCPGVTRLDPGDVEERLVDLEFRHALAELSQLELLDGDELEIRHPEILLQNGGIVHQLLGRFGFCFCLRLCLGFLLVSGHLGELGDEGLLEQRCGCHFLQLTCRQRGVQRRGHYFARPHFLARDPGRQIAEHQ